MYMYNLVRCLVYFTCVCIVHGIICVLCYIYVCMYTIVIHLSLSLSLSLPPSFSSFVLDAFKRVYSNEDIEKKAIPYLWENFDKEGWSLWQADYKYNAELKMDFMAANLIGGMFQRLEKLHKYGFASVLVFGENYKLTISGVWILRGHQLAFDV